MSLRPLDTTAAAWNAQRSAFRNLGPQGRLRAALEMSDALRDIRLSGIRSCHPEATAKSSPASSLRSTGRDRNDSELQIRDAPAVPLQVYLLLCPASPKLPVMKHLQRERETEILRRMTPGQKLAVLRGLIRQAWDLKAAAVRARRPDLSEPEVRARARELVGGDGP